MPRYALHLAYDGTGFAGWWRQPGLRTVAGELDAACVRLGEAGAQAVGASRTDAGVHARCQLAHVDLRRAWTPQQLHRALARHVPHDIAVQAVAQVDDAWHAVHGVRHKTYRYRLLTAPDPFMTRWAWQPTGTLDPARLAACASLACGERDWAAFVRRGDHREATTCRVLACRWWATPGGWWCSLRADGFIYRLARSLVGGMVLCARGGCTVEDWQRALQGTCTPAATQQAPAQGLTLWRVAHGLPLSA